MKFWGFAALLWLACWPVSAAQLAIIIDDMGNTAHDADAFGLDSAVTFAILPHTPFSKPFSQQASEQNREVMLHIPMESLSGAKLGPGALRASMYPNHIRHTLEQALTDVPNAIGLNNHMGSKLTQLTLPMRTTMDFLNEQGLYFIDSRTTRYSKAERIAHEFNVPVARRHVFLDHDPEGPHLRHQFQRLVRLAQRRGSAIGIGHPYPETLDFLKQQLPSLKGAGIELVPVSRLLQLSGYANVGKRSQNGGGLIGGEK